MEEGRNSSLEIKTPKACGCSRLDWEGAQAVRLCTGEERVREAWTWTPRSLEWISPLSLGGQKLKTLPAMIVTRSWGGDRGHLALHCTDRVEEMAEGSGEVGIEKK